MRIHISTITHRSFQYQILNKASDWPARDRYRQFENPSKNAQQNNSSDKHFLSLSQLKIDCNKVAFIPKSN